MSPLAWSYEVDYDQLRPKKSRSSDKHHDLPITINYRLARYQYTQMNSRPRELARPPANKEGQNQMVFLILVSKPALD